MALLLPRVKPRQLLQPQPQRPQLQRLGAQGQQGVGVAHVQLHPLQQPPMRCLLLRVEVQLLVVARSLQRSQLLWAQQVLHVQGVEEVGVEVEEGLQHCRSPRTSRHHPGPHHAGGWLPLMPAEVVGARL
jgi:hypothetical protein